MAACVDTLEATLKSFDCKLDSILYQLEHKCTQVDPESDENGFQPIVLSCVQIITTFKTIQNNLQHIKRQYKELEDMKEEANQQLMDKFNQMDTKVKELQQKISLNRL